VNAYLETGIQGKSAAFGTMAHTLNSIAPVDIDSGRFKYVLIRVVCEDPESKQESSKLIVRGYSWAAFHGKYLSFSCCLVTLLEALPFFFLCVF